MVHQSELERRHRQPAERLIRLVDHRVATGHVPPKLRIGATALDQLRRHGRKRSRGPTVRLADRLAAVLVPLVSLLTLLTVALRWSVVGPEQALLDGLCVALISCPCALGIATPLAYWMALGAAFERGALVHGGAVLEALARARRVLLDKTGTLTTGELELVAVRGSLEEAEALRLAALVEERSEHPVARALAAAGAAQVERAPGAVEDFEVLPGRGVAATVDGRRLSLERVESTQGGATCVGLFATDAGAEPRRPLAEFELVGRPRPEAAAVLTDLERAGLETRVLTGDGPGAAGALAGALGLEVEHSLLPADKLERVRAAGPGTVFVGDGLNDSAALAAAEVGVSMASGVTRSLEVAGVNLLRPGLHALPEVLDLARRAVRTARANLAWAFAYNAIGLPLAATGRLTPVFAAGAMVVSSVGVVLLSSRLKGRLTGRSGSTLPRPHPSRPGSDLTSPPGFTFAGNQTP